MDLKIAHLALYPMVWGKLCHLITDFADSGGEVLEVVKKVLVERMREQVQKRIIMLLIGISFIELALVSKPACKRHIHVPLISPMWGERRASQKVLNYRLSGHHPSWGCSADSKSATGMTASDLFCLVRGVLCLVSR